MWKNPINNETNLLNWNNQEILMGKDCTMIHHQGAKKWLTGSSTGSTSSRSSAVKPSVELCFPGVCITIIPIATQFFFLICTSSPTTTTNYLFFRKILSFLCMMKNEWASLSYDFSVCILIVTSFISKEEETSLTATWRDRVNQDPPEEPLSTGCYYDPVVDEHQMSWYPVPSYHPFFMVSLWVAG